MLGGGWESLPGAAADGTLAPAMSLGEAITQGRDHLGSFSMPHGDGGLTVDAWSTIIEGEDGVPAFRLVALVAGPAPDRSILDDLAEQVREKDTQLLELQHRVKNNLQMITALIRIEARGIADRSTGRGSTGWRDGSRRWACCTAPWARRAISAKSTWESI